VIEERGRVIADYVAGNGAGRGYSVWRFENGDQSFNQFQFTLQSVVNPDRSRKWTVVGTYVMTEGTGRMKGIKGHGRYSGRGEFLLVTGESMGLLVSDSGAGPFNDLSGRCVSQVLYVKGVGRNQGHCVFMDRAGDQWLLEFEAPAQKLGTATQHGMVKYLGETGKFAGVRGEGEYAYTSLRPVADGTYQGYSKFKGHYRLE